MPIRRVWGLSLGPILGFFLLAAPLGQEAWSQLPGAETQAAQETPGLITRGLIQIRQVQAKLQQQLSGLVKDIKRDGGLGPVLSLIVLSFLYGVFHAAGPGLGKVVISSYLLTHGSRIWAALSAILLVGTMALLLDLPRLQVIGQVRTLELASYGLIIALGLWMLYGTLTGRGAAMPTTIPKMTAITMGRNTDLAASPDGLAVSPAWCSRSASGPAPARSSSCCSPWPTTCCRSAWPRPSPWRLGPA